MKIKSKKVNRENFKKYGNVVLAPAGEPTAQAGDFKFWSDLGHFTINGETEIGICTVFRQFTNEVSVVERHTQTPEILIPIDGSFVLPLLLDSNTDDKLEAFTVHIGEAVVIDENVWHGPCLPLAQDALSYYVIFRRGTHHNDVEKRTISSVYVEI